MKLKSPSRMVVETLIVVGPFLIQTVLFSSRRRRALLRNDTLLANYCDLSRSEL
jgi:hypothetical protein